MKNEIVDDLDDKALAAADGEAVMDSCIHGTSLDPEIGKRVGARAKQIRDEIYRKHGLVDWAVPLIRECRGELPVEPCSSLHDQASLPPEKLEDDPLAAADEAAVWAGVINGTPVDPEIGRRVGERAKKVRDEIYRKHGLVDWAVPLIRELRGELPEV